MSALGKDALLAPLQSALRGAQADEVELWAHRRRAAISRYSHSSIHQNALSDETHVHARAVVGRAVGIASTNGLEVVSLRELVEDAASLARLQPPNAEWPGVAEPAGTAPAHACDEATARLDAGEQAAAIDAIAREAVRRGFRAAGTHQLEIHEDAVANSRGVVVYAPSTLAYVRALVQSDVGSGYADDLAIRISELDPRSVATRAADKCERDRDRTQLEPGEYEAVFEEDAVAEILRVVSLTGLGGQAVREGRSFMSGRLGERVTGVRFTLHDDALDPRQLGIPFDVEGTPKRRVTLVEGGVARSPVYDRTAAKAAGVSSTGHAADHRWRSTTGGHAGNLVMAGGTASREELIASVKRGILITRFHYTNMPDPKSATMTGTTRDGTFLIENGRMTRALANVRYTMSSLELFEGIDLLGPQRLVRDWWSTNGMGSVVSVAPAMKVSRAIITGSSPA